jgi:hypothetical protein
LKDDKFLTSIFVAVAAWLIHGAWGIKECKQMRIGDKKKLFNNENTHNILLIITSHNATTRINCAKKKNLDPS